MQFLTDNIMGPHFLLDGKGGVGETLRVRPMYAGAGKVCLMISADRRKLNITVDAAELVEAVIKSVLGCTVETSK